MDKFNDMLLVTANVGSLFDNVGEIQNGWLEELYKTIQKYKPQFIALHFQEVGGKDYMVNMDKAESFFCTIESSEEMKEFDRSCIYVDTEFQTEDSFTVNPHTARLTVGVNACICRLKALGSMYFIHRALKNIYQYDFNAKDFKTVSGQTKYVGSLNGVCTVEKEKFPKNFWPDFKWSRKGFLRTRWIIHNQGLDLVNIHLFHDASNLIAVNSSPSIYSANRKKALRYVINRVSDSPSNPIPFFLFGDFNFRLDTLTLVQRLTIEADVVKVMKDRTNEVEKIIFEEKDDGRQMLLQIEEKLFEYVHQAVFRKDNGRALLKYDKEITSFHDVIREEDITFPPSYPYIEDSNQPKQYMNTRCPAWCDRILMSHTAHDLINRRDDDDAQSVVYNTIGPNVCMGDHKPVFLSFLLKTNNH